MNQDVTHNVEIVSLKLDLSHPSGKHKLSFTLKNNSFLSKTYNLVYQINTCRDIEKIVFITHGIQKYEVYTKKTCVSNKKSTLQFFSEMISTTDDTDRSNLFSFSEVINFNRTQKVLLKENEEYKETLPYSWIYYITDNDKIEGISLGIFELEFKNIQDPDKWKVNNFLSVTLKKNNSAANIEWNVKNLNINSSFIEAKKFPATKSTGSKYSWIVQSDIYTEYVPYEDNVKLNSLESEKGIYLPQYEVLSPFNINLELNFDFLYSLSYEMHILLDRKKSAIGTNCSISLYCAKIVEYDWNKNDSINIFKFNKEFVKKFLLSGFSYDLFLDEKKNRDAKI